MNQRLKLLTQKKDITNGQANIQNQAVQNAQIFSKKVEPPKQVEEDDDDHNDILAVINNSTSFQVKQENSQGLLSDKADKGNNGNKKSMQNILLQLNQSDDLTKSSNVNYESSSRMEKEEEIAFQEQENYLKKKLKKPVATLNPVLMKFQNKQNNNPRIQIQQQNEIVEPKMEEEQEEGDIIKSMQEQKQLKRDKSFGNNQTMEDEQSSNTAGNSKKLNEQITPNKRQFSVSTNNQSNINNNLNDSNSSDQLIMRIKGKTNDATFQNTPNSNENKFKQNVNNDFNQKIHQQKANIGVSEDEEDDEDDDDIEHLKSISISTQKTQNTQMNPSQQATSKQSTHQQFSIFPMMNEIDNLANPQQQPKLNENKANSINKIPTANKQPEKKQDIDMSMFDALFEANEQSRVDDKMDEEKEDKKSVNDISMFIQINQEIEEEMDDIFADDQSNKNSKVTQMQQIQQKMTNNVVNNGMSKGLQSLLKRNQDSSNQNSNGLQQQSSNQQNSNSNSLLKPQLFSNQQSSNNLFSKQKDQQQQNTNQQLFQNDQSKVTSLLNQYSQPKPPQQQPNKEIPQTKPISQPQQIQPYQKQSIQNIQNKPNFPQIRVNNQPEDSDGDDEEEMKLAFQKQNTTKPPPPKPQINLLNKFGQNNKPQENNLNTSSSLSNSLLNQSVAANQNKMTNNLFKTPVQNSKTNQTKITQYSPSANQNEEEDYFYQNFESSYQNLMNGAKPNNRFNNNNNNNNYANEESMNLSKGNASRMQMQNNSSYQTTAKKQMKKQVPQVTPYKINLQLYQKKKKIKQSVEECKVWHYYLDKMYNLTSQQFEVKLANSAIPKELREYNVRQIFRGTFNNKKIPFLTVIMIEFEILHQIIKATLLDFSCSIIGSFSKSLFMDDTGENNQSLIIKKEEPQDDDENEEDEENQSDDDFINRNYNMNFEGGGQMSKPEKKKKEKKMDFSTVYTLNHERGTQISLKLNTLFVLKDVTVIQQNEEPPFLNISEKNVVQVVYPF